MGRSLVSHTNGFPVVHRFLVACQRKCKSGFDSRRRQMNLAIVGCGFVADYYLATLPLHPEPRILGVTDKAPERGELLSRSYAVLTYPSLAPIEPMHWHNE